MSAHPTSPADTQVAAVPPRPKTPAGVWAMRAFAALAILLTATTFSIVLGVLFPRIPAFGSLGTLFESFFSLHITFAALGAFLLALMARALGGKRVAVVTAVFAALAMIGSLVPLTALGRAASRYNVPLSWEDHLHVAARGPAPAPNSSELYAAIDGRSLYADVYLAANPPAAVPTAAVLMIHGGGYSGGARSDGRNWDHWLTARGYTVFDIDYRLDPPVTWNLAAQDTACAMAWIGAHAAQYRIDPNRVLIAGQSAGAGLALQVAYGLGDGTVSSSCSGSVPQPRAVFALYPPDDFAMGWDQRTGIGPLGARALNSAYIGGSPQQFPERYRAVSAVFHVRPGLPPTLIAAGEHDHLVPFEGHTELIAKLSQEGVPNLLVTIPYSDHAYDAAWGSLGAQITRQAFADFLSRYLPVVEAR